MINLKDYKENLTENDIEKILLKYDIKPVKYTNNAIIFPTCCHNLEGGSPKLYYYKNNKIFKCYTECGSFDIFELIIKLEKLRGNEITLYEASLLLGADYKKIENEQNISIKKQLNYLYEINNKIIDTDYTFNQLDSSILDRYIFSKDVLKIWQQEGISLETMKKYNIKYDPISNAIVIPHYDDENNLIGVRGRFLSEDAIAKYKPMLYSKIILSHPTSKSLYGLHKTKEAIKKYKTVILFEGEKSVLKMDSIYDENNVSVAICGKNISQTHINLLLKYGVKNVIIAFDRDYTNYKEAIQKLEEYKTAAKYVKNFFNTSILIDFNFKLGYKDSPIDKGEVTFKELLKYKIQVD